MKQWNILFGIGAAVYTFGGIVFLLGVNANVETWGRAPDNLDSMKVVEKSKCDYEGEKSANTNQVSIDINNNCTGHANTAFKH